MSRAIKSASCDSLTVVYTHCARMLSCLIAPS